MPEITTLLSQRESEAITEYAQANGVTAEEAIRQLAVKNLADRLQVKRKRGEVKTFQSPNKA